MGVLFEPDNKDEYSHRYLYNWGSSFWGSLSKQVIYLSVLKVLQEMLVITVFHPCFLDLGVFNFMYNTHYMNLSSVVLIIPPNDAEAILIYQLAKAMDLPVIRSGQTHGASLDKGRDMVPLVKKGGYTDVVIVEMPGPKTEARLKKLGVTLHIIDHHHYTGLNRAHGDDGKILPSSLEQFIEFFQLDEKKIEKLGFDPRLVFGVGIMDRGYVWALQREGYSSIDLKRVLTFHDELISPLRNPKTEERKQRSAKKAWDNRKTWNEFVVIDSGADVALRPRISRIIVEEIGKPIPVIIVERKRKLVYVQESPYGMGLFHAFGGFTFGVDMNWGYRNEKGKPYVGLKEIKLFIEQNGV